MKRAVFSFLTTFVLGAQLNATEASNHWIEEYITTVPDFPKPGIQFKWYPDLLKNPEAFPSELLRLLRIGIVILNLDAIVGLDSRGFIFGTALAYEMNLPFIMVRKAGKAPS